MSLQHLRATNTRGNSERNARRASLWASAAVFVLALLGTSVARGEETPLGRFRWKTYGEEVGATWTVQTIAQDSHGFLWVGSDAGLFRYDGRRFHKVVLPQGVGMTNVLYLVAGLDGDMWALTDGGVALLHDERWEKLDSLAFGHDRNTRVAVDSSGNAWLTGNKGVFELRDGKLEPVPGWPGGAASGVFIGPSGRLLVGAKGKVWERSADGDWRALCEGRIGDDMVVKVIADPRGGLWALQIKALIRIPPDGGDCKATDISAVATGAFERDGAIWFWSGRRFLELSLYGEHREVTGFPETQLVDFFYDRDGSLWLGGHHLHRAFGAGRWMVHGTEQGLPSKTVWIAFRDRGGTLWAGTLQGLARATAKGWEVVKELPVRSTSAITQDPDGYLWVGTNKRGLFRYDPATANVVSIDLPADLEKITTYSLAIEPNGTVWAATSVGVFRGLRDGNAHRFAAVALPDGPPTELFRKVTIDACGYVWLASNKGLIVHEDGRFRRLTRKDGLRSDDLMTVVSRRNGQTCVSYDAPGGVTCFRYVDGTLEGIHHFDQSAGLQSEISAPLGEDVSGRLWIASGTALYVADDRIQGTLTHADGLPDGDFSLWGFWSDPSGDIWLGTIEGLGHFKGGGRVVWPPPGPRVPLASARAGNEEMSIRAPGVRLPFARRTVAFDIAIPSFINESSLRHEVRLRGLEETFRTSSEWEYHYPNLNPGTYTFEVRARYPFGEYGPIERFSFTIEPPWWQTWWFRGLVGALLVGVVLAFVQWRQYALRRRNQELEVLVAQRTAALESAQARLVELERETTEQQMAGGFAHEMRNALTGARVLLHTLQDEQGQPLVNESAEKLKELISTLRETLPPEQRRRPLLLIRDLGRIGARIEEALSGIENALTRATGVTGMILEYARLGKESPGDDPIALRGLIDSIFDESKSDVEAHGIVLVNEVPEGYVVHGREAHIYAVLKNLVVNARDALVERLEGERRVVVDAEQREGDLVLRVRDTGIGIAPEHLARLFEPFFSTKAVRGTGLGLGMVKKILGLYGATIHFESELGVGTVVTVTLRRRG